MSAEPVLSRQRFGVRQSSGALGVTLEKKEKPFTLEAVATKAAEDRRTPKRSRGTVAQFLADDGGGNLPF